jgi:hypothetical protein
VFLQDHTQKVLDEQKIADLSQAALGHLIQTKEPNSNKYNEEMRACVRKLAPYMSANAVHRALCVALNQFGMKTVKIPAPATIANMIVEMEMASKLQLAMEVCLAQHASWAQDATGKAGSKYACASISTPAEGGGVQTRALSIQKVASGSSVDEAAGYKQMMAIMKALADAVLGKETTVAGKLGFQKFVAANGGQGMLTDHAAGETKIGDIYEEWVLTEMQKDAVFAEKPLPEQQLAARFFRAFCYEHKIDNIGKEIVVALNNLSIDAGDLAPADLGRGKFPDTGINLIKSIHKMVGKSSSGDSLLLHSDFLRYCQNKGYTDVVTVLHSLGPHVGDRFWALFKNASRVFYMAKTIREYLEQRVVTKKSEKSKAPNLLEATVLRQLKIPRVMAEILCLSIWHYTAMLPLLNSGNLMVNYYDVYNVIRMMHKFFVDIRDDAVRALLATTKESELCPSVRCFPGNEELFQNHVPFSWADWLVFNEIFGGDLSTFCTLKYSVAAMLQITAAAAAMKCEFMSKDMLEADMDMLDPSHFTALPANNVKPCESVFAKMTWLMSSNHNESVLSLSGKVTFSTNKTQEFIEKLEHGNPQERQTAQKIKDYISTAKNVQAARREQKEHEQGIEDQQLKEQARKDEEANMKAAEKEALSNMHRTGKLIIHPDRLDDVMCSPAMKGKPGDDAYNLQFRFLKVSNKRTHSHPHNKIGLIIRVCRLIKFLHVSHEALLLLRILGGWCEVFATFEILHTDKVSTTPDRPGKQTDRHHHPVSVHV